jgi:hypothetical protein
MEMHGAKNSKTGNGNIGQTNAAHTEPVARGVGILKVPVNSSSISQDTAILFWPFNSQCCTYVIQGHVQSTIRKVRFP